KLSFFEEKLIKFKDESAKDLSERDRLKTSLFNAQKNLEDLMSTNKLNLEEKERLEKTLKLSEARIEKMDSENALLQKEVLELKDKLKEMAEVHQKNLSKIESDKLYEFTNELTKVKKELASCKKSATSYKSQLALLRAEI